MVTAQAGGDTTDLSGNHLAGQAPCGQPSPHLRSLAGWSTGKAPKSAAKLCFAFLPRFEASASSFSTGLACSSPCVDSHGLALSATWLLRLELEVARVRRLLQVFFVGMVFETIALLREVWGSLEGV